MTAVICNLLIALAIVQAAQPVADAGRVTGRVLAEGSNAPIAGARVLLMPAAPPRNGNFRPPSEAVTDADGRFEFDRLPSGDYRLDVQKTGYVPYPGTPGRPQTISVAADQPITRIDVRLQKGGAIAGRLNDASGEPLTDIGVMALRRVSTAGGTVRYLPTSGPTYQTDDLGQFRVSGLAAGDYIIAATPRRQFSLFGRGGVATPAANGPRTTITTTYYPGTSDQASAQTISVAAGQSIDNVVFTMLSSPAFRVSGIVVDEGGNAVAGAMVMLMAGQRSGVLMGPLGNARTQDDGTFVIADLPPGNYRLTASVPVTRGGTGSGAISWSSSGSGGATSGATSGVVYSGGQMPTPTDVVVADADVGGVRVTVRR